MRLLLAAAVLFVLAVAPVAQAGEFKRCVVVLGPPAIGEAVTTEIAIRRGYREVNPLYRWAPARYTLEAAAAPAVCWGVSRIAETHPKLAKGIKWGTVGLFVGKIVWNGYQLHKGRRR